MTITDTIALACFLKAVAVHASSGPPRAGRMRALRSVSHEPYSRAPRFEPLLATELTAPGGARRAAEVISGHPRPTDREATAAVEGRA